MNIFEIDTSSNHCDNSQHVCCKPKFSCNFKNGPTTPPPQPRSKKQWPDPGNCGKHNENGSADNHIRIKVPGISSQEGEWPHMCLIFENGNIIGGASLIAPKVLVTAAHKLV